MSPNALQRAVMALLVVAWVQSLQLGAAVAQDPGQEADAAAPAPASPEPEPDTIEFKLSLPTIEDREAWEIPGFRLQLGYSFGQLMGANEEPGAFLHAVVIRTGLRLEGPWSLMGTLRYALATEGVEGVRFSGTVDPTWHITPALRLALALGFAGFVETVPAREEPEGDRRDELVAPYTFPDTTRLLPQCSGTGAIASLRLEYWLVIGSLMSTGPSLQADVQWTGCEEDLNRVEPDTAEPIVRRQWWHHYALSAAWMLAWR